jgi:metal-sulfur cluster biosynthetic enzyme
MNADQNTEPLVDTPVTLNRAQQARQEAAPDEVHLWDALGDVQDPEFPMSVVDMGLIYGLRREGSIVHVQITFTAMGCPAMEYILSDIRERLMKEPNVSQVDLEIVWDPPWTRRQLSQKGIEKLKRWGVSV